jgi:predicted PurR-regulated permease PerM
MFTVLIPEARLYLHQAFKNCIFSKRFMNIVRLTHRCLIFIAIIGSLFLFSFIFCRTEDQTQSLNLARQVLYHCTTKPALKIINAFFVYEKQKSNWLLNIKQISGDFISSSKNLSGNSLRLFYGDNYIIQK